MSLKGVRENWSCKIPPPQLLDRANELIKDSRKVYDTVAAVADSDVSYKSVLKVSTLI